MNKISGYTYVRNNYALDYCVHLTIESMLPWVDEVVVCDRDSTDGETKNLLWHLHHNFGDRIRIINMPWDDPCGDIKFLVKWMNFTREHCRYKNQFYLDADEVLDPDCGHLLRHIPEGEARVFHRLNFFRDGRTLIPHGFTCSHQVVRYGPTELPCTSDEIYGEGQFEGPEPMIRQIAKTDDRLRIFHYGFLRKQEAMHDKCRVVLKAFFNTWDDRLTRAKALGVRWEDVCGYPVPCIPYEGKHPEIAIPWLKERGAI